MTGELTPPVMRRALDLARMGIGQTSPNPMVGAVVVKDGQVVGEGFHTWAGVRHAEVIALEQAGERARGAALYVTLEPCAHQGRTGPCAEAVIAAGIARVVAAAEDPNPLVSGRGFARLREAGIVVERAAEFQAEAEKLNEPFAYFMRHGRPLVTLKAALTLDGKIAAPEDNQGWITSDLARKHVQQVRHAHDAIVTGIGTVLADDPMLTDRTGRERSRPFLRIVMDSQLRTPLHSRLVESARGDVLVAATSLASAERREALEARGVEVIVCDGPGGRVSPQQLVAELGRRRYLSLMVEGGSKLNWAMLESGAVDRIYFYYAPKILGGMLSLPVAGGVGRPSRADAIRFRDVTLHTVTRNEFAVEAYLEKEDAACSPAS
ncbi:MAG: bifunctional diaminohydroxyphosphoribosylaminopyrimidine deaminase/5-amino-6-(5-phosphoribosylamino)uracil reductase RibD [Bryobacterales bacterium]|nr:bifunctional diaminohydroxyphosphoribosylaminopyrimidine deaminase/5-amino-6-(5-phosphoribosylamino)uracil reductase RibD [Bryobacterales bacterium]